MFWKRPMLSKEAQERVEACIKAAERRTSGEVRVFVEHKCAYVEPLERAKEVFKSLGMEQTSARNAVLIYVATADRQFALFGDTAIYEKAGGAQFWKLAADKLLGHLKRDELAEGLSNCVTELGNALATHFPYDPSVKKNELPDEIVFGK